MVLRAYLHDFRFTWKKQQRGIHFNTIQDEGWGQKDPHKSVPPVNFSNIETSPEHFLSFSFNFFVTLIQNFWAIPSASSTLFNLNQEYPLKNSIFRSNPNKIGVVITYLREMLDLPNFGHVTATTIWFKSNDKTLPMTS